MKQESLFKNSSKSASTNPLINIMHTPLANRVRPRTLHDFIGQSKLLGKHGILRNLIKNHDIPCMILWGTPGCGKTTLAEIIARNTKANFLQFSAADASIKTIKKVMRRAEALKKMNNRQTIVFVDEIHRFNKAQQDAFLPYTENGGIILIGATTENPSFSLRSALLSRCKVFKFHPLTVHDIITLLKHAIKSKYGYPKYNISISNHNLTTIANFANGDARKALNTLAIAIDNGYKSGKHITITSKSLKDLLGNKLLRYDSHSDEHYDLISALHKSVRNSDVDSAIYWLYRMLAGGEDPMYLARRIVRMSSEDVGLADPGALTTCIDAYEACKFIGLPECKLALTEAVVRLSLDPKSNSLYQAELKVEHDIQETGNLSVPLQIRNAPTKLMAKLGYKHNYKYAENYQNHTTSMRTMPKRLQYRQYYHPSGYGWEANCKHQLRHLKNIKYLHHVHGDKQLNTFKPMDLHQFDSNKKK